MGKLEEVSQKNPRSSNPRKSVEKKSKNTKKRKAEVQESSDSGEDTRSSPEAKKTVKKPKPPPTDDEDSGGDTGDARTKLQQNKEGNSYVDLGKKKRVTVRSFKGSTLVDIREYYAPADGGDDKPGKKGISLSVEQWKSLVEASEAISSLL